MFPLIRFSARVILFVSNRKWFPRKLHVPQRAYFNSNSNIKNRFAFCFCWVCYWCNSDLLTVRFCSTAGDFSNRHFQNTSTKSNRKIPSLFMHQERLVINNGISLKSVLTCCLLVLAGRNRLRNQTYPPSAS